MTNPVLKWRARARRDLESLIDYIAQDKPDAARSLLTEIHLKTELLPTHPCLYRLGTLPGTREMVVHNNYVVIYANAPEEIHILRVLHSAQKRP